VLRCEGDPVDDGVEVEVAECPVHRLRIADVAVQHGRARGERAVLAEAAVEDVEIDAALDGQV
jgi:hypothetical protein